MNCYLSRNEINSFKTDVVCLKLISDSEIRYADIKWSADSDIVRIRSFSGVGEFDFNDGILLTLVDVGTTTVTAELDGVKYNCKVTVYEPRCAKESDKFNFYVGDFHTHSSWDHTQSGFPRREKDFPIDIIESDVKDGRLDFTVLSDHGSLMQNTDLFRVFYDADRADCNGLIVFPGSESECIDCHVDEFGLPQRESGEFVTVNAADYIFTDNYEQVDEILSRNPYAIVSIAHPTAFATKYGNGCMSTPRLYNAQKLPNWKKAVKLCEIGNGTDRGTTILFEFSYSLALDLGYKLSAVSTSDCHGEPHEVAWGFDAWPGKTVILAPEKTKDYFIDSILKHHIYGTENGNTALYYTVNSAMMGATLPLSNTYNFHVEIGNLDQSKPNVTKRCEVISDYGKCIKVIEGVDFSSFDFTVESDTARYFYLRIVDEDGLKTWSAPVFTGREYDTEKSNENLSLIDSSKFTATAENADNADVLFSRNPSVYMQSESSSDTITVDMKEETTFNAVRLHVPAHNLSTFRSQKISETPVIAQFPAKYRISVSTDGENYALVNEGLIRSFGVGYTVWTENTTARFVKIDLVSTVGKYCARPIHKDYNIALGEIEFFK